MPDTGIITAASTNGGGTPSFAQRQLEVTITLASNQQSNQPIKFTGTDSNSATFSGFRTSVSIENNGSLGGFLASVRMYGLNPSHINQLCVLGQQFNSVSNNKLLVSAGSAGSTLTPIFAGTVKFGYPNYDEMPNVPMCFECQSGYIEAILPAPALSFSQPTPVATIISGIAAQMNVGFENNGINVILPPSYFSGTLGDQLRSIREHANINADLVDNETKIAIWPLGGSRTSQQGNNIPLISKSTGMIRSPGVMANGYLVVKTLFNPQIAHVSTVQIQSDSFPAANKSWVVYKSNLELQSMIPKGKWEQELYCYPLGGEAPAPLGTALK